MTDTTDNARGPELLPCPFCGGKDVDMNLYGDWRVHCYRCGADGPAIPYARDDKATTWNTRAALAPDPLADPRVKALVAAADAYVEAADPVAGTEQISEEEWDEYCDTREAYRAALAALEGGKTDE